VRLITYRNIEYSDYDLSDGHSRDLHQTRRWQAELGRQPVVHADGLAGLSQNALSICFAVTPTLHSRNKLHPAHPQAADNDVGEWGNGARGRDRTADTAIFNRMLYQLSYPGKSDACPMLEQRL
jgi:hypothetical protein